MYLKGWSRSSQYKWCGCGLSQYHTIHGVAGGVVIEVLVSCPVWFAAWFFLIMTWIPFHIQCSLLETVHTIDFKWKTLCRYNTHNNSSTVTIQPSGFTYVSPKSTLTADANFSHRSETAYALSTPHVVGLTVYSLESYNMFNCDKVKNNGGIHGPSILELFYSS